MGDSQILPPSEYPIFDEEGGWMRGSTVKLGQRGSVPLLSISIEPLRNGSTLSTLPPPIHEAKLPQHQRRGVACVDPASPVGIRQKKHPWRECLHVDRGKRKLLRDIGGVGVSSHYNHTWVH